MQFISGLDSVTLDNPFYGYSVEINLAFDVARFIGRYAHADYGPSYDHRSLIASTHWLTAANMETLAAFLRDHRGEDITLSLGATPTGFFPFGPDLGDIGDFTVYIDSHENGGVNMAPFRHFAPEIRLKLRAAPAYSLPAAINEGNLEIAGVNYRWPQNGINPTKHDGRTHGYTRSGTPYNIDTGFSADLTGSEFTLEGGAVNIGHFLREMGLPGRSDDIEISAPEHYYLFGPEHGSAGTYNTRLIINTLSVTHDRFNQFSVPVKFWMREAVA